MTQEIKPTYSTFEQAKLLKEKGFKSKSRYYDGSGKLVETPDILENDYRHTNNRMQRFRWEAPEQHVVVEWLRVNYGINVLPIESYTYPDEIKNRWKYQIINKKEKDRDIFNRKFFIESDYEFQSPQETYSAAFDYILNNLI